MNALLDYELQTGCLFSLTFIGGTEMLFSSSGSVTSCVKSNCLVKEHVHRIYIENILCVCVSVQPNQIEFCLFLSLYEFVIQENALAKSEPFLYPASVLLFKMYVSSEQCVCFKSSSRLICAVLWFAVLVR